MRHDESFFLTSRDAKYLKKRSLSLASGHRSNVVLLTFTLSYFPCSL